MFFVVALYVISDLSKYFIVLFVLFTTVGFLQIRYSGFSVQTFPKAKGEKKVNLGKLDFTDLVYVAIRIWNNKEP